MKTLNLIGVAALVALSLSLAPATALADEVSDRATTDRIIKQVQSKPTMSDKNHAGVVGIAGYGTYPSRKGTILVTGDKWNYLPTGHAAIVMGRDTVVEALKPVVTTGKNNWYATKNTAWGLSVKRTSVQQDVNAADWASAQRGKPYELQGNKDRRDVFYCSHLVWAAFRDVTGVDLDTIDYTYYWVHPMELVWTDETDIIWKKH